MKESGCLIDERIEPGNGVESKFNEPRCSLFLCCIRSGVNKEAQAEKNNFVLQRKVTLIWCCISNYPSLNLNQ